MSKFTVFRAKCAATVATAATLGSNTVATLFPRSSNTVATQHGTLHWLLSRLKTAFYSRVSSNSSNTFPNYSQEINDLREDVEISPVDDVFPDSYDLGDEFDHEDYDEWWEDAADYYEDEDSEWDWDYDEEGEPLDPVEEVVSWTRRAVDEAIDEEQEDQSFEFYDEPSDDNQS